MRTNYGANPAPRACRPPMSNTQKSPKVQVGVSTEAIDTYPLGMSYVPWQNWGPVFNCEDALAAGTVFPELYMPYSGGRGKCNG